MRMQKIGFRERGNMACLIGCNCAYNEGLALPLVKKSDEISGLEAAPRSSGTKRIDHVRGHQKFLMYDDAKAASISFALVLPQPACSPMPGRSLSPKLSETSLGLCAM